MQHVSIRVFVEGRVQGVWFRAWTEREARGLGLTGWVRNCPDGRVEALLCGPEARVQEMIAELHRGPPDARVRDVSFEPDEEEPVPDEFSVTC